MRSSLLSVKRDLQAFLVLASVLISVLRKSFVCMRRIRFWHTFLVRCTDTPLHDCPHWDRDSQWMWFSGPKKYDLWPRCPLDVVTLLTRHTFQPAQCGMLYFWARDNLPLFVCVCSYILIYSVNYVNGEKGKQDAWYMSAWYCWINIFWHKYFTWQEVQCQVKQSWQLISCTVGMQDKYWTDKIYAIGYG